MTLATANAPATTRSTSLPDSIRVEPLTCAIGAELSNVNLGRRLARRPRWSPRSARCCSSTRCCSSATRTSRAPSTSPSRATSASSKTTRWPAATPRTRAWCASTRSPDTPNDRYENSWHTDATWREKPPFGCVLRCVECPPVGGDTMWANMALAYERLPEHVKTQIAGLRARHSIEASFGAAMPIEKRLALHAQFPDAEHPVVRTHPETGEKILFVNALHHALHQLPHAGQRALRPGLHARRARSCCST